MRRHLILTLAIMIALTTILSAPIGSGPTPACAKQQFEQPEKTFDGDPEWFDPTKPSYPRSEVQGGPHGAATTESHSSESLVRFVLWMLTKIVVGFRA
jgi:hypothetical protein